MPGRLVPLVNGEFYHIYNRGSDKRNIFLQNRDYIRFQKTFYYYQFLGPKVRFSKFAKSTLNLFNPTLNEKLVEILCFCLMPNHFHLLLVQQKENGISSFISQLANSYTKYFNTKYSRVGALFQGVFKSVRISSDEQLIHISRYIHINPIVSGLTKNLKNYKWSSYSEYLRNRETFCQISTILNLFPSSKKYSEFIENQISYGTTLEMIKHQKID
ncbi:transposase [Candidatus Daviesbacteria bacterium]|nr:transposase [Candidatus Daviesbacteria bacterium]